MVVDTDEVRGLFRREAKEDLCDGVVVDQLRRWCASRRHARGAVDP
jgi:hypothetical protein